jgi:hypothetical protein
VCSSRSQVLSILTCLNSLFMFEWALQRFWQDWQFVFVKVSSCICICIQRQGKSWREGPWQSARASVYILHQKAWLLCVGSSKGANLSVGRYTSRWAHKRCTNHKVRTSNGLTSNPDPLFMYTLPSKHTLGFGTRKHDSRKNHPVQEVSGASFIT